MGICNYIKYFTITNEEWKEILLHSLHNTIDELSTVMFNKYNDNYDVVKIILETFNSNGINYKTKIKQLSENKNVDVNTQTLQFIYNEVFRNKKRGK